MGVLPAVIASINSDPPAKEQTQYTITELAIANGVSPPGPQ